MKKNFYINYFFILLPFSLMSVKTIISMQNLEKRVGVSKKETLNTVFLEDKKDIIKKVDNITNTWDQLAPIIPERNFEFFCLGLVSCMSCLLPVLAASKEINLYLSPSLFILGIGAAGIIPGIIKCKPFQNIINYKKISKQFDKNTTELLSILNGDHYFTKKGDENITLNDLNLLIKFRDKLGNARLEREFNHYYSKNLKDISDLLETQIQKAEKSLSRRGKLPDCYIPYGV